MTSCEAGPAEAHSTCRQIVITIEEALPREVAGTSEVAKTITESGLGMAGRLVDTQYGLLRDVVKSAANSLRRDGAQSIAA
jgi:hypothetical protein